MILKIKKMILAQVEETGEKPVQNQEHLNGKRKEDQEVKLFVICLSASSMNIVRP
jgi:hypothetical protein